MRKLIRILCILPLSFLLFSCMTTESETVVETEDKTVVSEEKTTEKEAVWITVEVDEFFVSQETIKYDDGFVDGYRLYEYSDSGQILKNSHIGSDERIISSEIYNYNNDGLMMKSYFFSGGDEVSHSEFSYNGNKQLIEESYFNPEGQLLAVSSYEYDEKGRRIKWVSGDSGGIPMMYTEYAYKKDKLAQMNYYMPSGEMEGFTQLEYKGDKLISEASYSANSKLEKKTEYAVVDDMTMSISYFSGNNLIRTVELEYDDAGNVVVQRTKNRHGDVIDIVEKEYVVFSIEKTVMQ
jgi:hypothetical protein